MNLFQDCWRGCGGWAVRTDASCPNFCGTNGVCCRAGWNLSPSQCRVNGEATLGGLRNHQCVDGTPAYTSPPVPPYPNPPGIAVPPSPPNPPTAPGLAVDLGENLSGGGRLSPAGIVILLLFLVVVLCCMCQICLVLYLVYRRKLVNQMMDAMDKGAFDASIGVGNMARSITRTLTRSFSIGVPSAGVPSAGVPEVEAATKKTTTIRSIPTMAPSPASSSAAHASVSTPPSAAAREGTNLTVDARVVRPGVARARAAQEVQASQEAAAPGDPDVAAGNSPTDFVATVADTVAETVVAPVAETVMSAYGAADKADDTAWKGGYV